MWLVRNKDNTLEIFYTVEKPFYNKRWQSVDKYGTISYGEPISIKSKLTFNKSPKRLK